MTDSEYERSVSARWTLRLDGVASRFGSGEPGGLGSFLCVFKAVLDLGAGGVDFVSVLGGGVADIRAARVDDATELAAGVLSGCCREIPRPWDASGVVMHGSVDPECSTPRLSALAGVGGRCALVACRVSILV